MLIKEIRNYSTSGQTFVLIELNYLLKACIVRNA